MKREKSDWIINNFISIIKSSHSSYTTREDGDVVLITKGKNDCIELVKNNLILITYKHSSEECKVDCKEFENIIKVLEKAWFDIKNK